MSFQETLPGVKHVSHSNLGEGFEDELNAVHRFYLLNAVVDVVKNPNAWDFARDKFYWKYKKIYEDGGREAARTGDGRFLMRVYSEVDYSGGGFIFDAKETKQNKFPFSMVHDQQVHRLRQSARCGSRAGLMIKFSSLDRVFFVPIEAFSKKYERWLAQSAVRAKAGTASLSITECEEIGKEIFRSKHNQLWDWYSVLNK